MNALASIGSPVPWLISRFIDPKPEFLFVPASQVMETAAREGATPYDVPAVELGHHGAQCSFDAFLDALRARRPRAGDARHASCEAPTPTIAALTPESAGLYAAATGFQAISRDDFDNMARQFPMYDALYAYCRPGDARGAAPPARALRVSARRREERGRGRALPPARDRARPGSRRGGRGHGAGRGAGAARR